MKNQIDINQLVNCNSIEMTDGSKWITWYLKQKKSLPINSLRALVYILEDIY